MSYKVDSDKAFRILRCLAPPIIFINGIPRVGKTTFAEKFKSEGFSVYNIGDTQDRISKAQSYLRRMRKSNNPQSVILEGWIENPEELAEIFVEHPNYSYVWLYANQGDNYWKQHSNKDTKTRDLVKTMLQKQRKLYELHLEEYDQKILTVLI